MKRREEERFENNAQAEFAPSRERSNGRKIERSHLCEARRKGKERLRKRRTGRWWGNAARSVGIRSPPPRSTAERLFFELGSRVELWIRKP